MKILNILVRLFPCLLRRKKRPTKPSPEKLPAPKIKKIEKVEVVEKEDIEPVKEKIRHVPKFFWCIDAGHGAKQAGKRSPVLPDGRQFFEWEFNHDIATRIDAQLKDTGIHYMLTNEKPENVGSWLRGRVKKAKGAQTKLTKIFVSIHANAAPGEGWQRQKGVETFHHPLSTQSEFVANIFQSHIVANTGFHDRKVKPGNFYVLRETPFPAVLTENGFFTNLAECKLLLTDEYRQRIADAHVNAIFELENYQPNEIQKHV